MHYFYLYIGIFIGMIPLIIYLIMHRHKYIIGKLVINTTNPNKDTYRFEFDDLRKIENHAYVYLKIEKES